MSAVKRFRAPSALLLACCGALALSGCGGKSEPKTTVEREIPTDTFGIRAIAGTLRTAPDEFSVVSKAPLVVPDDLGALPPPDASAPNRRDPTPIANARNVLLPGAAQRPQAVAASQGPSPSERAILAAAGAADPSIRETLAAEQAEIASQDDLYILDRVIPALRRLRPADTGEMLDAEAERQRIAGVSPVDAPVDAPASVAAPAPPQAGIYEPLPAPTALPPASAPAYEDSGLIYLPE